MNLYPYLIALIVLQDIVFLTAIHRLVNKLMSRNYHEYQMSDKIVTNAALEPALPNVNDEPEEDLAHII